MILHLLLHRRQRIITRLQLHTHRMIRILRSHHLIHLLCRINRRIIRHRIHTRIKHRERRRTIIHRNLTVINRRSLHTLNIHLHRRQRRLINSPLIKKAPMRARTVQTKIRMLLRTLQRIRSTHRRMLTIRASLHHLIRHLTQRRHRTPQSIPIQQRRVTLRNLRTQQTTRIRTITRTQRMKILPHLTRRTIHQLIRHNQRRSSHRNRHHNTDHPHCQNPLHGRKITHRTRVTQVVR